MDSRFLVCHDIFQMGVVKVVTPLIVMRQRQELVKQGREISLHDTWLKLRGGQKEQKLRMPQLLP